MFYLTQKMINYVTNTAFILPLCHNYLFGYRQYAHAVNDIKPVTILIHSTHLVWYLQETGNIFKTFIYF